MTSAGTDSETAGGVCGNGVIDGDEQCDDADDINSNGCNVDCLVSAQAMWVVAGEESDSAFRLEVAANGVVIAGDKGGAPFMAKYSHDGELL